MEEDAIIQQIILEQVIRIIDEDEVNSKLQNRILGRIALKTNTIFKVANVQELVKEALIELLDELKLQFEQVNNLFEKYIL